MALVKRHWKPALLSMTVIGLVIALGWAASALTGQPAAHGDAVAEEPIMELDTDAWSDIRRLRRELSLENGDLAGIGCDMARAAAVLGSVKQWYFTNEEALRQRTRSVNEARAQVRRTQRRVHMGPRDEAVLRQLADRKTALQQAEAQRKALVDQLIPVVQSRLTQPQATAWSAVRNARAVGGFGKYVYASGLTAQQAEQLRREVGLKGRRQASAVDLAARREADRQLTEAEGRILTASQQEEVAAGDLNGRVGTGEVLRADAAVLPTPGQLLPPELGEPHEGQIE